MGKYDNNTPMMDSSPGSEDYRDTIGANAIDETAVVLIWSDGDSMFCKCGCLTPRTPGSKSEFKQGHDARLKGILQRAHVRGSEVTIVNGAMMSSDAMTVASSRGWERFLEKAANTAEAKARKATTRKPGKTAGKVANADLLGSMKAALAVLATIGRDKGEGKIEVTRDNWASILDGSHPDLERHADSGIVQGRTVRVNRRGWRDATVTGIRGDRAEIAYATDGGNSTTAVVDIESILAWAKESSK